MNVDLRIAETDWSALRRHLASSFRGTMSAETGALGILGELNTASRRAFIVTKVLLPEPGDLKIASTGEVVFDASYIRRAHLEMRRDGLAGIATFHTHPLSDARVGFSPYDDRQDPLLAENLTELDGRTQLVSVVVGKQTQCGRVFSPGKPLQWLHELTLVGERLTYLGLDGLPPPPPPKPEEIFDRGLPLTGSGALSRLAKMTIVVVGASGTGSLMCELLARAGCKRIIVIDHDIVKIINLNRILHGTAEDARLGTPKVEVLRRGIEGIGIGCRVIPIRGTILDRDVLRRAYDGDLVIGCIDRDLPRQLLCDAAFRYLIPYIDLGSEIGGDDDGIVSLDGRVSYVAPGRNCLMCAGVVSPRRLRFESLTDAERQREIALGYSDDLLITQPAVMDLNMGPARQGMFLLRHLLQPFLKEPLPVKLCENAVTYRTIPVSAAVNANAACPTCQRNRRLGRGDCAPALGFDAATALKLLGADGESLKTSVESDLPKLPPKAPHFLRRVLQHLFRRTG